MTHIPIKPMNTPMVVCRLGLLFAYINPMMTTQIGKMDPMIEAKPAWMYLTPQVLRPLLKTKLSTDKMINGTKCPLFGKACRLYIKYKIKHAPPISCLIPAICKAGMVNTAFFDTTQVVPQTRLTMAKATRAKK